MEAGDAIATGIAGLNDRGVRLVASEFGAGFSSLRNLGRLALLGLKLAPVLITDVEPGASGGERTIAAIAAAAREFGLELYASGVETPEQLAVLKSCGFSEADGPLFSDAVPAREVEGLAPFASVVGV